MLDGEFITPSRALLEAFVQNDFALVTSALVQRELREAPEAVHLAVADALAGADLVQITQEALDLQQAYLDAEIVGQASAQDALHVAIASVALCPMIVSWNFRHIVHYQKIRLYNAVNTMRAYPVIAIHSPLELVGRGDQT